MMAAPRPDGSWRKGRRITRVLRSFYTRIALVFLFLLATMGTAYTFIAFSASARLIAETEQRLGRPYARNIASELAPFIEGEISLDRLQDLIHYMMVLNPRVEIYLLDDTGRILAYFTDPPAEVRLEAVPLETVRRFLDGQEDRLLYGPDPRNPGRTKPFSAAPLRIGDRTGFVYIILGGERYESAFQGLNESYILRATLTGFLLALGLTAVVGLLLFGILTRRLRVLENTVRSFEQGDLSLRVPFGTLSPDRGDEIDSLGRSFNTMADTIASNIERLELTDNRRRELVAHISHDFRSPLTSIRSYLETLQMKDESLAPDRRRRFVETALANTLNLQLLVEQFFELARLDTRGVHPRTEPFHPAELVDQVVHAQKPRAEQAGVDLGTTITTGLPLVLADPLMTERVLMNLLDNALRYTPSGGSIRIDVSHGADGVRFVVSDTGSGIPADLLPHLFDPFFAAPRTSHRPKGSGGLGLAIAHRIVELHGGRLEVESTPGRGTRFMFSLPTEEATG